MSFYVGSTVRIKGEFTAGDGGAPTNPTTTTITVEKPDGTDTAYTGGQLTNPTTGTLYVDVVPDAAGRWDYRIVGTGAVAAVHQGSFICVGTNIEV